MSASDGVSPENSKVVCAASYCRLPLDHLQPHRPDHLHELLLSDVQRGEHGAADSVVMFPQRALHHHQTSRLEVPGRKEIVTSQSNSQHLLESSAQDYFEVFRVSTDDVKHEGADHDVHLLVEQLGTEHLVTGEVALQDTSDGLPDLQSIGNSEMQWFYWCMSLELVEVVWRHISCCKD